MGEYAYKSNVDVASTHATTTNSDNTSYQLQIINDARARELLPAIIFVGCLIVLGVLGNSLVVYVFYRKFKPSTQTTLYMALACFDLMTSCIAMPFEIFDMVNFFMFDNSVFCKLMRSCITFSSVASNFILMLIAIDRYKKVCRPLKRQITPKRARKFVVFFVLLAIMFTIPAFFLYGLRSAATPVPGIVGLDCSTSDAMKDTVFPVIYESVLMVAFVCFVITFAILYGLIWEATRRKRFVSQTFRSETGKLSSSRRASVISSEASSPFLKKTRRRTTSALSSILTPRLWGTPKSPGPVGTPKSHSPLATPRTRSPPGSPETQSPPGSPKTRSRMGSQKTERNRGTPRSGSPNRKPKDNTSPARSPRESRIFKFQISSGCGDLTPGDLSTALSSSVIKMNRRTKMSKSTIIAFTVTSVYFLSFVPHLCLVLAKNIVRDFDYHLSGAELVSFNIFLRSFLLNAVANPIVYAIMNINFRRECVKMVHNVFRSRCHVKVCANVVKQGPSNGPRRL